MCAPGGESYRAYVNGNTRQDRKPQYIYFVYICSVQVYFTVAQQITRAVLSQGGQRDAAVNFGT